jgi:hypothetical protein
MENSYEYKGTNIMMNKRVLFSTLWIFAVLNYLYCDVVSLMDANLLKQYLTGSVEGMELTQTFLLLAGILMEVSISMVLLSRILPYKTNRLANMIAGTITTGVQIATLFGSPTMYYMFFSAIEITCTLSILLIAFRWSEPEVQS